MAKQCRAWVCTIRNGDDGGLVRRGRKRSELSRKNWGRWWCWIGFYEYIRGMVSNPSYGRNGRIESHGGRLGRVSRTITGCTSLSKRMRKNMGPILKQTEHLMLCTFVYRYFYFRKVVFTTTMATSPQRPSAPCSYIPPWKQNASHMHH